MHIKKIIHRIAAAFISVLAISSAQAQAGSEDSSSNENDKIALKFTPSFYQSSNDTHAADVNLRGSIAAQTAWLGFYRDSTHFQQTRAGYEYRSDLGLLRTVFSAQLASGGFLGGSVTAEIGEKNYAIVGWGRTNVKDYYNLNFDPNDAITLGLGSRAIDKTELSLFHIWDDRLHTQQHVTHAVVRYKPTERERWTVDASQKRGHTGGGNFIHGYAASITYDYGNSFARIAHDQYVNFSDATQNRFSLGMRF